MTALAPYILLLFRFAKFAKEFKISGFVNFSSSLSKSQGKVPLIALGDVDVVYKTVTKKIEQKDVASTSMTATNTNPKLPNNSPQFKPSGSGVYASIFPNKKQQTVNVSQMSFNQFIVAVEELAIRCYSNVIEKETGTVLECLPVKQKAMAIRAAVDVMMLERMVPGALHLGEPLQFLLYVIYFIMMWC